MTIIWWMVPEIWSATDITFCHSGQFFALPPPGGKTPENIIILHVCTTNDNHICVVLEVQSVTDTTFCHFKPSPLLTNRKIKIKKNEKTTWRYYHFTHVYHKWQSYDVWFLRYGAWWTQFFCHFRLFFALLPP